MKHINKILFIVFSITLLSAGQSIASQFTDPSLIGVGARALGMGSTYSTIGDDAASMFSNPAGLGKVSKFSAITMYSQLLNELPYTMFGAAYRTNIGVIGLGYAGMSVGDIKESTLVSGIPQITGSNATYNNYTVILSLANNVRLLNGRDAYVGAGFKYISYAFSGAASFEGNRAAGYDIDLGTVIPINDWLSGSLSLKNIIPGYNIKTDELPLTVMTGLLVKVPDKGLSLVLDAETKNRTLLHFGAEWKPVSLIAVRAGLEQKSDGTNYTFGLGTNIQGLTFDYAYHTYAQLSEFSTHLFSIGYTPE